MATRFWFRHGSIWWCNWQGRWISIWTSWNNCLYTRTISIPSEAFLFLCKGLLAFPFEIVLQFWKYWWMAGCLKKNSTQFNLAYMFALNINFVDTFELIFHIYFPWNVYRHKILVDICDLYAIFFSISQHVFCMYCIYNFNNGFCMYCIFNFNN